MNWQHSASSPMIFHDLPYLWLFTLKRILTPRNNIPHPPFLLATSFKSLIDRSWFWQNGPARQHVRKEPAKNKFLLDFHFELTAQRLFSSDLPPPPKSLVYTRKAIPAPQKKVLSPETIFFASILFTLPPSSKSLVDKGIYWQNGPASQHVRKEPAKNEFLVDFHFDLTA